MRSRNRTIALLKKQLVVVSYMDKATNYKLLVFHPEDTMKPMRVVIIIIII